LVMYSALFSKLWRLSKLLSMRRQAVRVQQVLLPFCVTMAASVVVLVVWQVVDPFTWVRTVINEHPLETFGECQSGDNVGNGLLPYIIPLGLLILVICSMTAVVAWRMKDVQSELSESKWIFFGIIMHIQTWAVGMPVVVITDGISRDAWYIMVASLTFIVPTALVVLVIWPKVYVWARDEYFGGPPRVSMNRLSVVAGKDIRVSGLHTCQNDSSTALPTGMSTGSPVLDMSRISELESEIATLRQQLIVAETNDGSAPDERAP
jgi:hypothetical protein